MSPPFWTSFPLSILSHPSRLLQSMEFELPASYSKFPPTIYFTYGNFLKFCFHATLSICPTLSFPHYVHKSVLYVYVSIAALQIDWSVPSF